MSTESELPVEDQDSAGSSTAPGGEHGDAEAVKEKPQGGSVVVRSVWAAFTKTNVYTWMLGLSILAIAIALACLGAELARYEWDIKATRHPTIPAVDTTK